MKHRLLLPLSLGILVLALLALAAACGQASEEGQPTASPQATATTPAAGTPTASPTVRPCQLVEPPPEGNMFQNPGFEEGHDPWCVLRPPDFVVSTDVAQSGSASAHLQMRDTKDSPEDNIYYLVQEIAPENFPEVLSGYYRVDKWVKGTKKQYLQFVVIAFTPVNMPAVCEGKACPNYQIRYILAGIDQEPFPIGNAKFVFLTREDPKQGEWVPFERNLQQDFQELWGAVPAGFDKLRILFEVRYDDKQPNEEPLEADVYYDDLYVGPPR